MTLLPGRVREVVRAPHAALGTPSGSVDPLAAETAQLAADLVATMRHATGCVGLAAVQVGIVADLFVVDVSGHPKTLTSHGLLVLANARVIETSRNEKAREGCLSVPDLTGDVTRATRITVAGQVPGTTDEVTIETDGFEARAVQHEIDHCAGLLFLDRVAGAHALFPRKVYL